MADPPQYPLTGCIAATVAGDIRVDCSYSTLDDKPLADRLPPLISSSMKDDIINSKEGTKNNIEHGLKVMSVLSASGGCSVYVTMATSAEHNHVISGL